MGPVKNLMLDAIQQADTEMLLEEIAARFEQQQPRVVITIDGGNYQGAMASCPMSVRIYDVDNLKAEGKTEQQRERIFRRMTRGMRAVG